MKKYDVIIIGGGPAGSVCGKLLADSGLNVALLDKAAFPRKKLCGGLLTKKAINFIKDIYSLSVEDLIEKELINYSSDSYSMFHKNDLFFAGEVETPFHLVDRTVFDNFLLLEARKAGVNIFEDTTVIGLSPRTGHVYTKDERVLQARHIIGADGANSIVRNHFPLEKNSWTKNLAGAVEIRVPKEDFPVCSDHPHLYIDVVDSGYGWVFPNKTEMVVGICGLQKKNKNFGSLFKEYLKMLGVEDVAAFQKKYPLKGHPLPYGNVVNRPVFGKTLLVGDAGGFVETLLGEGIFYAIATGKYSAEAIIEAEKSGSAVKGIYTERLKNTVLPEIRWSKALRFLLFNGLKFLGIKPIKKFTSLCARPLGQMVHGDRSYNLFRRKKW